MTSRPEEPIGLGEFEELRREAEELQRLFDTGQKSSATYTGEDPAEAVRVTVDGGGRVSKVEVGREWRKAVGVAGLGQAVLQAVNDATAKRLTAWGNAVADNEKQQRGASTDRGGSARRGGRRPAAAGEEPRRQSEAAEPAGDPSSAGARETMNEIFGLLDGIEAELDEFERRVDDHANSEVSGRSRGHHVTVSMSGGGQVSKVDIDERWLDRAHETRVSGELQEAFQDAYGRAGEATLSALMGDGSNLAKIQAMASNPEELLKKLGLSDSQ